MQEEHNQSGDEETEMEAVVQKKEVTIYKIDQESGELITEVKECEELNERIIWKYLVEAKVVPEDSEALSMVKDGEQLQLDSIVFFFSIAFASSPHEAEIIKTPINAVISHLVNFFFIFS